MTATLIPEWLKRDVIALATLIYDGENYQYAVVAPAFGLRNGISGNFTIAKNGVLAVSNACHPKYRELYLIHEVIESDDTCRNHEVCLRALKKELALAKERGFDMREYVEDRLLFFVEVANYYERNQHLGDEYLDACIKIKRSLLYLRSLKARASTMKKSW